MLILHHAHATHRQGQGSRTLEATSPAFGVTAFEVRLVELDARACLPACDHAGQLAVVVLAGQGKLLLAGGPQRFAAPCSLFIPPQTTYQIANNASATLQMVMVCTLPPSEVSAPAADAATPDAPARPAGAHANAEWPVAGVALAPSDDAP
jgi:quercetin dioxygenase-like cupin family protein